MPYINQIRSSLEKGTFLYTLEYVPELITPADTSAWLERLKALARPVASDPRIAGLNIGDRVRGTHSVGTVDCGHVAAEVTGKMPLLHLAGKDREPAEARAVFERAASLGLTNFLVLTGDKIPEPTRPGRPRYHDSAVGVADAKRIVPNSLVAVGFAFKYHEEEMMNQYLKLIKKLKAGSDYIVTNCGWDMDKFQELIWYVRGRGYHAPLVANLLAPAPGWAKSIHARKLAGIFMSDDLFRLMEEERVDKTARQRRFQRVALQIVGVKLMGYAGVHLSGVDDYETLCQVIEMADAFEQATSSLDDWKRQWTEMHRKKDGQPVRFGLRNGCYLFNQIPPSFGSLSGPVTPGEGVGPKAEEKRKYVQLKKVHHWIFDERSFVARVLGPAVVAAEDNAVTRPFLRSIEHMSKSTTLGCEMCGFCRIEHLMYTCPETCPKGLANGACGGTDENICEFKDRECIHNRKYRLAKAYGKLDLLENEMIPIVEGTRGTSSWANEFSGRDPLVQDLGTKQVSALDLGGSASLKETDEHQLIALSEDSQSIHINIDR